MFFSGIDIVIKEVKEISLDERAGRALAQNVV